MNIPKWLHWPLAAAGLIGAVGVAANGVRNDVARTITLHGTPAEVEAAIRAKFPDKTVQDAAVESMDRRLVYITQQYQNAHVTTLSWDFYLDTEHGNSLFPKDFDHSQRAQVSVRKDDGSNETIDFDVTQVPQDVTDNSRQKVGQ